MVQKIIDYFHSISPAQIKEEIKAFFPITIGSVLYAFVVTAFVQPAKLPSAGVTGISLFINYLWGVPVGLSNALLNVALFVYAWKFLPKRFLYWSVYSTALMSLAFGIAARLPMLELDDRLLRVIVAGVLQGLALAMPFSAGASTGGTDIITMAVRRKTGMEVGSLTMIFNLAVMALFIPITSMEKLIYGLVMNYIMSQVMNTDMRSFGVRKEAMIVTTKTEEVKQFILNELHRGVTIFPARGGYSDEPRDVIVTLLSPRQSMLLKIYLKHTDKRAFLRLSDTSEVLGRGFSNWNDNV